MAGARDQVYADVGQFPEVQAGEHKDVAQPKANDFKPAEAPEVRVEYFKHEENELHAFAYHSKPPTISNKSSKAKLNQEDAILTADIKEHMGNLLGLPSDTDLNTRLALLDTISRDLNAQKYMDDKLKDTIRIYVEQYRLAIMQHVLIQLSKHDREVKEALKKEKEDKEISWSKLGIYGVGMVILETFALGEGFNGVTEVVGEIGLGGMTTFGIGLACSLVSAAMLYILEGSALRKSFGVSSSKSATSIIDLYEEQLKTTTALNAALKKANVNNIQIEHHKTYVSLTKSFNNILDTHKKQLNYVEAGWRRVARISLTGLGGMLFGCGVLFSLKSAITTIAWLTAGITFGMTPVAWFALGVVALSACCYYIKLQWNGLHSVVNPAAKKLKTAKKHFEHHNSNDQNTALDSALVSHTSALEVHARNTQLSDELIRTQLQLKEVTTDRDAKIITIGDLSKTVAELQESEQRQAEEAEKISAAAAQLATAAGTMAATRHRPQTLTRENLPHTLHGGRKQPSCTLEQASEEKRSDLVATPVSA